MSDETLKLKLYSNKLKLGAVFKISVAALKGEQKKFWGGVKSQTHS